MVSFERVWCMPSRYTFQMSPVKELLDQEMEGNRFWVDPFAGKYSPCQITNDIDDTMPTKYHEDGLAFLKLMHPTLPSTSMGCLFDPPYSPEQARRCYKAKFEGIAGLMEYQAMCKNEIARWAGKVICFGWNSAGMGKQRGFELVRGMILCHGTRHDTIITVEVKR